MKRFGFLLVGLLMVTAGLRAETPVYADSQHIEYQMESPDLLDAENVVFNLDLPDKENHTETIKHYNDQSISTYLISFARNKHYIKSIKYDNLDLKTLKSNLYSTAIPPDLYRNRLI